MIPIKTDEEIQAMREACEAAATVLAELGKLVAPGISTYDLDQAGKKLMQELGVQSACYNYAVGARRFPSYTCISVNEEVVHGIGKLDRVLREGDSVTLDICVVKDGWIGDNAKTYAVGDIPAEVEFLLKSTEEALYCAIDQAIPGNRVGDISHTVQQFIEKRKLSVVRDFVGHGVGRTMHEDPQIPNYGRRKTGEKLAPGMTLAIEPMVNMGAAAVEVLDDGWTAVSRDRKPAAHFEHTVLITENGPEILTIPKKSS